MEKFDLVKVQKAKGPCLCLGERASMKCAWRRESKTQFTMKNSNSPRSKGSAESYYLCI